MLSLEAPIGILLRVANPWTFGVPGWRGAFVPVSGDAMFAAKGLTPSYGNMETCICDAYALWIVEALRRCIETH